MLILLGFFASGIGVGIALRLACVLLGSTMQFINTLIRAI